MKIIAYGLDPNDTKIKVVKLNFKQDDKIKADAIIAEVESSKTTFEITSPVKGYIDLKVSEEDIINVGDCIAEINDIISEKSLDRLDVSSANLKKFSKKAEKYIKDNNLNIADINEKIKDNYITERSLQRVYENTSKNSHFLSYHQQIVAQNVSRSNDEIPHCYLYSKFQIQKINTYLESNNNISINDILIKKLYETLFENKNLLLNFSNENFKKIDEIIIGNIVEYENNLFVTDYDHSDCSNLENIAIKRYEYLKNYYSNSLKNYRNKSNINISLLEDGFIEYQQPILYPSHTLMIAFGSPIEKHIGITIAYDHRCFNGLLMSNLMSKLKKNIEKGVN